MTGAYSFVCNENSTDRLCARLNALGGWQWRLGDSHWYGDYVACVPFEGVRIRIVDFPATVSDGYRYEADIRLRDSKAALSVVDEAFRKVLGQIEAHDIKEIESFD